MRRGAEPQRRRVSLSARRPPRGRDRRRCTWLRTARPAASGWVMVGILPTGGQPVPIPLAISRERELVGAFRFNDEIYEVIAALADGSLVVEDPVITHEFGIEDTSGASGVWG